jgi:hypothetical protein
MRSFLIIILLVSKQAVLFGQITSKETELIIIGTRHDGTKKFNHKTLYKLIKRLNPDIILWEQSTEFKRVFGLRTANFLKIMKPGIEQLTLQKYSKRRKAIEIYPFDTTIAFRHNYIKTKTKLDILFFGSLNNVKKSIGDSIKYSEFAIKRNYYYGLTETQTLEKINNPEIFNLAKEIYELNKTLIQPLSRQYLSDTSLISAFEQEQTFWILRNNFMVRQIKKYLIEHQEKKILVLTGLNHKYYLVENLLNDTMINIKLRNIAEN